MLQNDCAIMVITSKARINSWEAIFAVFPFNHFEAGTAHSSDSPVVVQFARVLCVVYRAGQTPHPQSFPFRDLLSPSNTDCYN